MIHVVPADEPDDFDRVVRRRGQRAIAEMVGKPPPFPRTAGKPFSQRRRRIDLGDGSVVDELVTDEGDLPPTEFPTYWTDALDALMDAYDLTCAYSCFRIHEVTGARSVDHFAPKSRRWDAVYEWHNYRLACSRMNARKNDFGEVLDPFEVENGWFQLELYGFQVRPAPGLEPDLHDRIVATIERLKLNNYEMCGARERDVTNYEQRRVCLEILLEESPFVAMELRRQERLHDDDQ